MLAYGAFFRIAMQYSVPALNYIFLYVGSFVISAVPYTKKSPSYRLLTDKRGIKSLEIVEPPAENKE